MEDQYISLISGLIGAVIGAAASVITIIVQSHYQNKREMTKEAIALALQDWKTRLEIGGTALPLVAFISYHTKLIALAEKGELTPEAIKLLSKEQTDIVNAIVEAKNNA